MLKKIVLSIFILFLLACGLFAQTAQTVTLKPGFNFIGFTASISSTPALLKTQNPVIEDIYLFSAAAGSFLSATEGTLSTLAAGKGYIIKSNYASDTIINIPGDAVQTIGNINLKTGFNLIGFSKIPATTLSFSSLMNVYSAIKGIYKWSPAAGSFIQVARDNSGAVALLDGADPSFKAGESYFFNMAEDTTINYDGSNIILGNGPPAPIEKTLELTGIVGASAPASPSYSLARAIDLSAMQISVYDEINNVSVEGAVITATGNDTFKATLPVATADRYLSVLVKNSENKIIYLSFAPENPYKQVVSI